MRDKVQIVITLLVVGVYLGLVIVGKAHVEGFCVLAVYIIKKALDIIEQNGGTK